MSMPGIPQSPTHPAPPIRPRLAPRLAPPAKSSSILGTRLGVRSRATVEVREFCRNILDSEDYKESLIRRIRADVLPAGVECLLYYYAYGRPVDRMKVTFNEKVREGLHTLTTSELLARVDRLRNELKAAADADDAEQA